MFILRLNSVLLCAGGWKSEWPFLLWGQKLTETCGWCGGLWGKCLSTLTAKNGAYCFIIRDIKYHFLKTNLTQIYVCFSMNPFKKARYISPKKYVNTVPMKLMSWSVIGSSLNCRCNSPR